MTCEKVAVDAAVDTIVLPPDTPDGCYGSGIVTVCPDSPITGNTQVSITTSTTLSTTTSPLCVPYHLPSGAPDRTYCVVAAKTVSISSTGRWTVNGTRPLVVVATMTMTIDGTIDAASHRGGNTGPNADPVACPVAGIPTDDAGGPGGSFGTVGGEGGAAANNPKVLAGPSTPNPLALRGGCPGIDGNGGNAGEPGRGGGALSLIASTLQINGTINASGASGIGAGLSAGGGGGGAGGMIILDAPAITVGTLARIFANGGGGGEGGGASNGGNDGDDSASPTAISVGGGGNAGAGGDGGDGAAGTTAATAGENSDDSGGGGGGGAGVIRVFPSQTLAGSISPPPS